MSSLPRGDAGSPWTSAYDGPTPTTTPEQRARATRAAANHVANNDGSAEHLAELLDMLGLLPAKEEEP